MKDLIKKAALIAMAVGILTFAAYGLMAAMGGGSPKPATFPNEPGFKMTIIWFEVVNSADELFQALGDPATEQGKTLRAAMDRVNGNDYIFMILYSALNAALLYLLFVRGREKGLIPSTLRLLFGVGLAFAVVALFGDVFENVQLLELTGYKTVGEVSSGTIFLLQLFTRVKWFSLFLVCVFLAVGYAASSGKRGTLLILLYAAAAVTGLLSFTVPSLRSLLEMSATLLGVSWLASTVHAGILYFRKA